MLNSYEKTNCLLANEAHDTIGIMNEHDCAVLIKNASECNLEAGDVGTIVHIYENGKAFEVEFSSGSGSLIGLLTLAPDEIRPVLAEEVLHVRKIAV